MELKISNVCRLASADIKLNGLTVIVGENETGKSTVGRTLFTTIKAIANVNNGSDESKHDQIMKFSDSLYRRFMNLKKRIRTKEQEKYFPPLMMEFVKELQSAKDKESFLKDRMNYVVSLDIIPRQKTLILEDLINLQICLTETNPSANLSTELQFLIESEFINKFCSYGTRLSQVSLESERNGGIEYQIFKDIIKRVKSGDTSFIEDATYVESPLYLHMLDVILKARTYREVETLRRPLWGTAMVPSHIKDLALKVRSAAMLPHAKNEFFNSDEIINGYFEYDNEQGRLLFKRKDVDYSPINIASGIKAFGLLQLLANAQYISPNRMLIWDEPENHLHPEWQVKFAEALVTLSKYGIPILITTHSPYFLQAVRYYSAKLGMEKYVNYYMAQNIQKGLLKMEDVTTNLNEAFMSLAEPLNKIMNVDEVRQDN